MVKVTQSKTVQPTKVNKETKVTKSKAHLSKEDKEVKATKSQVVQPTKEVKDFKDTKSKAVDTTKSKASNLAKDEALQPKTPKVNKEVKIAKSKVVHLNKEDKEIKVTDLKGGYVGQSEIKTQKLLDESSIFLNIFKNMS